MDYLEPVDYRGKNRPLEGYRRGQPLLIGGKKYKEGSKKKEEENEEKGVNTDIEEVEKPADESGDNYREIDRVSIHPSLSGVDSWTPEHRPAKKPGKKDFCYEISLLPLKPPVLSKPADCTAEFIHNTDFSPFFIFKLTSYLSGLSLPPSIIPDIINYFMLLYFFQSFSSAGEIDFPFKSLCFSKRYFFGPAGKEFFEPSIYSPITELPGFSMERTSYGNM